MPKGIFVRKPMSEEHKELRSKAAKNSYKMKAHLNKIHKTFNGKGNPNWKGGKYIDGNGYVLVYAPDHPFPSTGKYIYEHRLVMEKIIGRYLLPEEQVHHTNEVKHDNRPENLVLFANASEHRKYHLQYNGSKS